MGTDSRDTLGPHPPSITIATPQDIWSALNVLSLDREPQGITRNIKEAMYIHVNDPSLNRNFGKYKLPHIWDQVSARHTSSPAQIIQLYLPLYGLIHPHTIIVGGMHNFIGKNSHVGVPSVFTPFIPYTSPDTPNTQNTPNPLHLISVVPSLVRTHIYSGTGLTFSLRPNEAASVWKQ